MKTHVSTPSPHLIDLKSAQGEVLTAIYYVYMYGRRIACHLGEVDNRWVLKYKKLLGVLSDVLSKTQVSVRPKSTLRARKKKSNSSSAGF